MRKDELKQAGIRVFSERGYHAAKVSDIVAEAGVAQGTFYLYFPSKQALFGSILADYLALLTGAVSSWNISDLGSVEQLRADLRRIGVEIARVMIHNRELTRIFFQEALAVDPEFNEQIAAFYDKLISLIRAVNEACYRQGVYRQVDFTVLAHCVVGMIERVVFEYVVNGDADEAAADTIVGEVIDLVLYGATAGEAPGIR